MNTDTQLERRGHTFLPPAAELAEIPTLYATKAVPTADKIVHLHYFAPNGDWWLTELDVEEGLGFGWACLNGDDQNAEWGYVSLEELEQLNVLRGLVIVERDCYWTPKPARECELPGYRS